MIRSAIAISSNRVLRALTLCAATGALVAMPASAQDDQDTMRDQEPDAADVLMTPVDDLNLDGDEIPALLVAVAEDPYAKPTSLACGDLKAEIGGLDQVLGPDYDLVEEDPKRLSEGKIAKKVVSSFVPFRGILREITGAASEKRELEAAIMAGLTRRAYLKGLGEASGCPYPARPAFVAIEIDEDDVVEMQPVEAD